MTVLITGANGQLGRALMAAAPSREAVKALSRHDLDLGDSAAIERVIAAQAPTLVINAAAYTQVDKAESDTATAMAINAVAPGLLAAEARRAGARFIHVSTDFVFAGDSATAYRPDGPTAPLGVYGQSKWQGEQAVRAAHDRALIVRTAWVYDSSGANFVRTMLRLMAEREEVRVVSDQIGTPTHAASLARALWALDAAGAHGTLHWTDAGIASWYDFAVAIQEEALALGLLDRRIPVVPIATSDYPTPARRPAMSVLDKRDTWAITGVAQHWRQELRAALQQMAR